MSALHVDAGELGRLLRSLDAAGYVGVEQEDADRRELTARSTDAGCTSIPRQLSTRPRDRLGAAVVELGPAVVASARGDLSEVLAAMGSRIAEHGCAGEPGVLLLVGALHRSRPVAAAVLASSTEPEIVRARAFLHVARAAAFGRERT